MNIRAIFSLFLIGFLVVQSIVLAPGPVCVEEISKNQPSDEVSPPPVETVPQMESSQAENNQIVNAAPLPASRRINPYPIPKWVQVSHIEGNGIGYEVGYTELDVVSGPEYQIGSVLPLVQLDGLFFNDGTCAANAGIIVRMLPSKLCEVFGVNLFYDFRQGRWGNFNQISGGFEVLHRRWEVHINAQVPVGRTKHQKKCVFDDYTGPYREVCKHRQFAEQFYDANFGYYLTKGKHFQLYAAAGPYYLGGHGEAWGGRAVLRPQYLDYFSIEFSVSYDHIFRTIYQANAIFSIPLYNYSSAMKRKTGPCNVTNRQIYQPISRTIALMKGSRKCHQNWPN